MKIEQLNDNQIRCTLTRADLADRQLKLSELVCGSEKAKSLFQDMMKQAASEFGFEAEDTPLMIEAVPASSDSIVLIITKVDDPEELDSKFSKFGATLQDFENRKANALDKLEGAEKTDSTSSKVRLFSFATLDSVIHACHLLKTMFHGSSTLYKDNADHVYILALAKSEHTSNEFNKICNMLSEYGSAEKTISAILAFLEEHCEIIVPVDVIQNLGNL